MSNNLKNKYLIFIILIMFLFFGKAVLVYATSHSGGLYNYGIGNFQSEDPESANQKRLPDYASSKVACASDWGEGRLLVENDINEDGTISYFDFEYIIFFKYVLAVDQYGKYTPLWLYRWSDASGSKEIEDILGKAGGGSSQYPDMIGQDGQRITYEGTLSQLIMLPVASDGQHSGLLNSGSDGAAISIIYLINYHAARISGHDIDNLSQLNNNPEAYWATWFPSANFDNVGHSYTGQYVMTNPTKEALSTNADKLTGFKYHYSNQSATDQPDIWASGRWGQKCYGYKINGQTWLTKKRLSVSESASHTTIDGKYHAMFLGYNGNFGQLRNVYSANVRQLGYQSEFSLFARDSSGTATTPRALLENIVNNPWDNVSTVTEGLLNLDFKTNGNKVTSFMRQTFVIMCQTFDGFYDKFKVVPIETLNSAPYELWMQYIDGAFMKSVQKVSYEGYATQETGCNCLVSRGPGKYNSLLSYTIGKVEQEPGAASINAGDIKIKDTTDAPAIQIVDVCDVFGVSAEQRTQIKNGNYSGLNARAQAIIKNAIEGVDVGPYLTKAEIARGAVSNANGTSLDSLEVGMPYVATVTLTYEPSSNYVQSKRDLVSFTKYAGLLAMTVELKQEFLNDLAGGMVVFDQQISTFEGNPQVQFLITTNGNANYDSTSSYSNTSQAMLGSEEWSQLNKSAETRATLFNELYVTSGSQSTYSSSRVSKIDFLSAPGARQKGIISTGGNDGVGYIAELVDYSGDASAAGILRSYALNAGSGGGSAASSLYGYWQLAANDYYGDGQSEMPYFMTFIVPETTSIAQGGKAFGTGNYLNSNGQNTNLPLGSATGVDTKGLKATAKIYYPQSYGGYKLFESTFLNKYYGAFSTIGWTAVQSIYNSYASGHPITNVTAGEGEITSITDTTVSVKMSASEQSLFRQQAKMFFQTAMQLPAGTSGRLTAYKKSSTLSLNWVDTIDVAKLISIIAEVAVDDSDFSNDQTMRMYNVDPPIDDLLISYGGNLGADNGAAYDALKRTKIDWTTAPQGNMDIQASANGAASNQLTGSYTIGGTGSNVGIYPHNEKYSGGYVTSKIYVGRIPEAEVDLNKASSKLTINDFKILALEKFNINYNYQTGEGWNPALDTNQTALTGTIYTMTNSTTADNLRSALSNFTSNYTPTFMYRLVAENATVSHCSIQATKVRTMKGAKVVNNKATSVQMNAWSGVSGANQEVMPGTVVEYTAKYIVPGTNDSRTTWNYLQQMIAQGYYNSGEGLDPNNYEDIVNIELDFQLVPRAFSGNKASDAYLAVDTNLKNNFAKELIRFDDGRNKYFTKVEVYNEGGGVVGSVSHAYGDGAKSDEIKVPISAFGQKLSNGYYSNNCYVRATIQYTSVFGQTSTLRSQMRVNNFFYNNSMLSGVVNSDSGGNQPSGTPFNFGFNSRQQILTIPLRNNELNGGLDKQIVVSVPFNQDNQIHTDWEQCYITVESEDKDNSIEDIELHAGSATGMTYGNYSRAGGTRAQLLDANFGTNYVGVVVVKRLIGSNIPEKYGTLAVTAAFNGNIYNAAQIFNGPNVAINGSTTLANFKNVGNTMRYVVNCGGGRTYIKLTAEYRTGKSIGDAYKDVEDSNLSNNTWEEEWGLGLDFSLQDMIAPADMTAMGGTAGGCGVGPGLVSGYTMATPVVWSFTASCKATGNLINLGQPVDISTSFPGSIMNVSGADSRVGNYLYINVGGAFDRQVTVQMNPRSYQSGKLYSGSARINSLNRYKEENYENNYTQDRFNVYSASGSPSLGICGDRICTTGVKTNAWSVEFRWSQKGNRAYNIKSIYKGDHQMHWAHPKNSPAYEYLACYCHCIGAFRGSDDNATKVMRYTETTSASIQIRTSSNWSWRGAGTVVHTGEYFQIRFLSGYDSNRDQLPLSPRNGLSPYGCDNGGGSAHACCNYLTRSPGVNWVTGPNIVHIVVSGTSRFGYNHMVYGAQTTLNYSTTHKLYQWMTFDTVTVPITNQDQTWNMSITQQQYWGHYWDPWHPKRQLCTSASANLLIRPSKTVVGTVMDDGDGTVKQTTTNSFIE